MVSLHNLPYLAEKKTLKSNHFSEQPKSKWLLEGSTEIKESAVSIYQPFGVLQSRSNSSNRGPLPVYPS